MSLIRYDIKIHRYDIIRYDIEKEKIQKSSKIPLCKGKRGVINIKQYSSDHSNAKGRNVSTKKIVKNSHLISQSDIEEDAPSASSSCLSRYAKRTPARSSRGE